MKFNILLYCIILLCLLFNKNQLYSQEVRVIDNKGTIKNINKVISSNATPTSNLEGDIWFDTNLDIIKIWDNDSDGLGTPGWRNLNEGSYIDSSGSLGASGQVLSSNGTGTSWINNPAAQNWLLTGNTGATNTNFLGTIDDVKMQIRSNNVQILEFGRRQTLGLTQSFLDYTNDNQYLVHVTGNNGVSALQFQADGALFYKPMFFTTPNGSFRLKGSSGRTDFFEIGSGGPNNEGRLEFTIADDGDEPIIFKRYDYRSGRFYREFFRVQGSSPNVDAKTRFGININTQQIPIANDINANYNSGSFRKANSTFEVNGSISKSILETTGNLTLTEDHYTVILDGNHNITLPAANSCKGRIYIIKNTFTYASTPTDNRPTISNYRDNNNNSISRIPNASVIKLQSDGTNWQLISNITNSKVNYGARWTNSTSSINLNTNTPTSIPIFGTQNYNDDTTLYSVTSSRTLTISESGRYDIRANISLINDFFSDDQRTSVNARLYINGVAIGALAATGYIRYRPYNANIHEKSSLHINEILQLSAGDQITIRTFRGANTGDVTFDGSGSSSIMINKIR